MIKTSIFTLGGKILTLSRLLKGEMCIWKNLDSN